jgi:hypothetical protein
MCEDSENPAVIRRAIDKGYVNSRNCPRCLNIRASSLGDSSADENLPHTTLIFLIGGKCLELLRVSLLLLFRGSELVVSVRCFLNFNDQSSSVQISSGKFR